MIAWSLLLVILLFVPYPSQTAHYHFVLSTATRLPNDAYLTTATSYSDVPTSTSIVATVDGSAVTSVLPTATAVPYTTVFTTTPKDDGLTVSTNVRTATRLRVSTATVTTGTQTTTLERNGQDITSTTELVSLSRSTDVMPFEFTREFTLSQSSASTTHSAAAEAALTVHKESLLSSALPSVLLLEQPVIRAGSGPTAWIVLTAILLMVEAAWLCAYVHWKTRRALRARLAEGDGGIEKASTNEKGEIAQRPAYIAFAKSQAGLLSLLAILLQVPLGFLIWAIQQNDQREAFLHGPVAEHGTSRFNPIAGYCLYATPTPTLRSGLGYSGATYRASPQECPLGQGAYEPDGPVRNATPVILLVVFGWTLVITALIFAALICRRKRPAPLREDEHSSRSEGVECWYVEHGTEGSLYASKFD